MEYLRLTITDAMGFWNDEFGSHVFDPTNGKTFTNWYRLPDGWLAANGKLKAARREAIFAHLYGPTWQSGNEDGSKYFVVKSVEKRLSTKTVDSHPWKGPGNLATKSARTVSLRRSATTNSKPAPRQASGGI